MITKLQRLSVFKTLFRIMSSESILIAIDTKEVKEINFFGDKVKFFDLMIPVLTAFISTLSERSKVMVFEYLEDGRFANDIKETYYNYCNKKEAKNNGQLTDTAKR